jgi:hypothetical protein
MFDMPDPTNMNAKVNRIILKSVSPDLLKIAPK